MADEKKHDDHEQPEHADIRYETVDIRFRPVLIAILATCVVFALVGYSVWRFFWYQVNRVEPSLYAIPASPTSPLPPAPLLEQLDRKSAGDAANVGTMLSEQERILHRYGPTDEEGFVHVPIRVAIERLAAEAEAGELPQRSEQPPTAALGQGLLDSGEPNSGRVFRGTGFQPVDNTAKMAVPPGCVFRGEMQ